MPTSTSFTALANGDGGLCGVPEYNCTIGQKDSTQAYNNEDYVTLGGHRGTSGGTPSSTQIKNSFIKAMKMYWNFHGVDVSGGLTGGGAFSSKDFSLSYTKVEAGDPDPVKTPVSWSVSTSASAALSKSFPTPSFTSDTPITGVCTTRNFLSEFTTTKGAEDSDTDNGEDSNDDGTVYSSSYAYVSLEGVGVGPPYDYYFKASGSPVRAFFDNGVFVGYGVVGLITSASYQITAYGAGGGSTEQPTSLCDIVCSFSLGGVTYDGDVGGLNPETVETKKVTIDGIPLLFQAGHYDMGGEGVLTMTVSQKTATFDATGGQVNGKVVTVTQPDTSTRENYIQTTTITNRTDAEFKFRVDGLRFWSY